MAKKILFCASRVSHIENFHRPYLQYYRDMGWDVHVAAEGAVSKNPNLPEATKCFDIPFCKRNFSLQNVKTVFRLRKLMLEQNYEIISSHATLAGLLSRAAVMLCGSRKPTVIHTSHGYLFREDGRLRSKLYLACEKWTSGAVDLLITMNQEDYEIAQKHHLSGKLGFINGMGVKPEEFPPLDSIQREKIHNRYHLTDENIVFLSVAEFSERKNQQLLIQAFAPIAEEYPHARLLLAGTGELMESCRTLAEALGIAGQVIFAGHVQPINELYQIADFLCSASRSEGLPFNLMEALYCHLPVLATAVKGHTDLITNGENGLLIAQKPEEFTAAMRLVLEDEALWNHLKQNAVLPEKYLLEQVKPQVLEYYKKSEEPVASETMNLGVEK